MLRRHKYILIALAVYWPAVFVLTHIPVPQIAAQSGMSDKTMHVMAYFSLTFLIWCAVSPYNRAHWNAAKPWIVVLCILVYAVIDEVLQMPVGRQAEVSDFLANLFGMALAMSIVSIFRFWSALLAAMATVVFVLSNLSHLTLLYPQFYLNTAFHLIAYTGLTLIWIQHIDQYLKLDRRRAIWPLTAALAPLAMLGASLAFGYWQGKPLWPIDIATAVFGILTAVLVSRVTLAFSHAAKQSTSK